MSLINLKFNAIGTVKSTRTEVKDDKWDSEKSYIELSSDFTEESLFGLSDFSHAEIIFYMDQVNPEKVVNTARHPRNREDWPKVGIFSQRGKNRPNQIGLTICKIIKIEGTRLYLEGLDAVDGTPVLDIKPWVNEFAPRGETSQPKWIGELMKSYWIEDDRS
ncbi:SAM-dependent methyltransferase [bacterium]|nr:SAM-dependent methyltransferase [bacterium]